MIKQLMLVLALGCAALAPTRLFAATEVFTVRNIPVDATAAGSAQAKDIAIAQGQHTAFDRLIHRLTRHQDWANVPQAAADQVADLVLGFEVAEERSSATRYVGKITYSFKPAAVKAFLRQAGIPFSEARSKPALLLPVLDAADGQRLWDDPNPWRSAWARRDLGDELVPIMVPMNGADDSSLVSASQALTANWGAVSPISVKYGLDRVLLAHASVRGGQIEVRLTQLSAAGTQAEGGFSVPLGANPDDAFDQAVSTALDRVYEDWKAQTIVVAGEQNSLYASIWFSNLADWLTIQRRLKQAPTISQIEIVGLSPQGAQVHLTYGGTVDQLHITLQQISLELNNRGAYWEIAMSERAAQTSAAPASSATDPSAPANGLATTPKAPDPASNTN